MSEAEYDLREIVEGLRKSLGTPEAEALWKERVRASMLDSTERDNDQKTAVAGGGE
jgi:hypothetical protein